MSYKVRSTPTFDKDFKKLDRSTQRIIKAWVEKNAKTPAPEEKL